jgi:hypothetical protein
MITVTKRSSADLSVNLLHSSIDDQAIFRRDALVALELHAARCQTGTMSPSKMPTSTASHCRSEAADSFNQIGTVRIELRDTDPLIWREVEVPTSVTLKVLHDIIQITMGWLDQHLWEFTIGERTYGPPMDDDWGTGRRTDAIKVRLRDVLKHDQMTIDYTLRLRRQLGAPSLRHRYPPRAARHFLSQLCRR